MPLADYQTLVDKMVRAPGGTETIATTDRDRAIEAARLRYSADAARWLVQDVTWEADGHLGPLPEGWTEGSELLQGEYPVGLKPQSLIDLSFYVTPTDQKLMSVEALGVGSVVRVTFTAPHVLVAGDEPQDTIPAAHREAVASYAASILCGQLAAYFSGERESSIGADHSNTDSRSRNFAARAKEYRAAYYGGIGKADPRGDKAGQAAGSGVDPAASVSSWKGRQRLNLTRISPP